MFGFTETVTIRVTENGHHARFRGILLWAQVREGQGLV